MTFFAPKETEKNSFLLCGGDNVRPPWPLNCEVSLCILGFRHADRSMETKTGRIFLLKNTSFSTFWEKLS